MSILDYFINEKDKEEEISFDSDGMYLKDTFDIQDLQQLDNEKNIYMCFHKNILNTIDGPA